MEILKKQNGRNVELRDEPDLNDKVEDTERTEMRIVEDTMMQQY